MALPTRAYWAGSAADLRAVDATAIVAELSRRTSTVFATDMKSQLRAWGRQIEILRQAFERFQPAANSWGVLLELPLHRLGRRIDAVVLIGDIVCVVEFKIGAKGHDGADIAQAEDYALCLRDFHSGSARRTIVPILCAEKAPDRAFPDWGAAVENVTQIILTNAQTLSAALNIAASKGGSQPQLDWRAFDQAPYNPTPTIIDAARAVYSGHSVREIGRSDAAAGAIDLASARLLEIAREAKAGTRKKICFVTGTPGAGKTLLGLNLAFLQAKSESKSALPSGNPPLVYVLQEALAEDTAKLHGGKKESKRRAQAALQNLLGYLKEHSDEGQPAPPEHIIVYDEAQRAWDEETGKQLLDRARSEPALFLDIMGRLEWSCLVCLVGPGQEINRGEGGLALWGQALNQAYLAGANWEVHASPKALQTNTALVGPGLLDSLDGAGLRVTEEPALHLDAGIRAYRNPAHGSWVEALLGGDVTEAHRIASEMSTAPVVVTRDLAKLRAWLRERSRGEHRCGLLASSGAVRHVAEGIPPAPRSNDLAPVAHWFLRPASDYRSSNSLEVPLSEFVCQGLEIDYVGLCWGGDLIWRDDNWSPRMMRAPKWQNIADPQRKIFRINAYRVLMTRARAGLGIYVPAGDATDPTRLPAQFDDIYDALTRAGCEPI